jgi:hypothetical protein
MATCIEQRVQKVTHNLNAIENEASQSQVKFEAEAHEVISSIRKEEFGMD